MAKPKDKTESGFGCIRRVSEKGKTVILIQNKNGWCHDTYTEMASSKGISGDYYVFSFPEKSGITHVEDITSKKYKLQKAEVVSAFGFNSFEKAQNKYIDLANSETGQKRKRWEANKKKMMTLTGEYS